VTHSLIHGSSGIQLLTKRLMTCRYKLTVQPMNFLIDSDVPIPIPRIGEKYQASTGIFEVLDVVHCPVHRSTKSGSVDHVDFEVTVMTSEKPVR
jgi:hypothetical protein